jgi:hypothetical protein
MPFAPTFETMHFEVFFALLSGGISNAEVTECVLIGGDGRRGTAQHFYR